jgi:hypothetical protein
MKLMLNIFSWMVKELKQDYNEFKKSTSIKGLFNRINSIYDMEKDIFTLEFNLIKLNNEIEIMELNYLNNKELMAEWKTEGVTNKESRIMKIKEIKEVDYTRRDNLKTQIAKIKLKLKHEKRLLKLGFANHNFYGGKFDGW